MVQLPILHRWRALVAISFIVALGFAQAPDKIATVNDDSITTLAFQQRVRYTRWSIGQQLSQVAHQDGLKALTDSSSPYNSQYMLLSDSQTLGQQVLDSLIAVKLVQQEAARRGISVTDDEVQQQVEAFFGYSPNAPGAAPAIQPGQTPQPPPNPTQLAQAFQSERDNYFGQAGVAAKMTQADVLAIFSEQALQIKVFKALTSDLPGQAEQIHVRHILVDSEDKARNLLAQIKDETTFASLAQADSLDTTNSAQGGDLGWAVRGVYVQEFDSAIWNGAPGQVIGPVKTQFGFHLIYIIAREVRPLGEIDLARARDARYRDWLKQARASASIKIVDQWQGLVPLDPTLQDLGLTANP